MIVAIMNEWMNRVLVLYLTSYFINYTSNKLNFQKIY